ncbi:hypothetical protein GGI20_002079 [Coemansia sp. BCRC 34301]|nr:hypothetical protein GGI20_002079 [Coemansia sp. BCRC 34301]
MTVRGTPTDWFYVCPKHTSTSAFCTPTASITTDTTNSDTAVAHAEQGNSNDTEVKDKSKEDQPLPAPSVQQYVLHKDYFYLRQRSYIKQWEKEQAKVFAQNFPTVPQSRPR